MAKNKEKYLKDFKMAVDADLTQNAIDVVNNLIDNKDIEPQEKKSLLGDFANQISERINIRDTDDVFGSAEDTTTHKWKLFADAVAPLMGKHTGFADELKGLVQASGESGVVTPNVQAQDSIIFGDEAVPAKQVATQNVASDEVDPITHAIREQIIQTQKALLQSWIAKDTNYEEVAKYDQDKFNAFLKNQDNKKIINQALNNTELQKEFSRIEVEGYKAVHQKFQGNFKPLDWNSFQGQDTRVQVVKNATGEEICTLVETTVKTKSQQVVKADGSAVTVNSYRTIDFPPSLEKGGTMHLSLAVKDENGNNIAAKNAVYFTAHYNKEGKLEEVSSPIPVKFAGEGKDAIGYIERDGHIYTLPVTKGKYEEMMQEVAKNQGQAVNLSQTVAMEERAKDGVIIGAEKGSEKGQEQNIIQAAAPDAAEEPSFLRSTPPPPPPRGMIFPSPQPPPPPPSAQVSFSPPPPPGVNQNVTVLTNKLIDNLTNPHNIKVVGAKLDEKQAGEIKTQYSVENFNKLNGTPSKTKFITNIVTSKLDNSDKKILLEQMQKIIPKDAPENAVIKNGIKLALENIDKPAKPAPPVKNAMQR